MSFCNKAFFVRLFVSWDVWGRQKKTHTHYTLWGHLETQEHWVSFPSFPRISLFLKRRKNWSCGCACECFHQSHWKGYNNTARWRKRPEILRTSHAKHTIIHSLWGFPPTLFFLFPLPIITDDANFVTMPKAKNRIPLQPVNQLQCNHPGKKSCYFPQIFPFMNSPNSYPST